MIEQITATHYLSFYDSHSNVKVYPVYALGNPNPDGDGHLMFSTVKGHVRFYLPKRLFENLPTTEEDASKRKALPLPYKLTQIIGRGTHF
ncbi:hypothetical protein [Erwinia sp. Leaf53]|uniref:hypothetical protein n=1 Tax=Erwinia sp. Leaf53 TaxID=1736225 RepID=UPI000AD99F21|nr:hypothetical protein [Erwinia sp. Leaf53]